MTRPLVTADECLLTARECAERAKVHASDWWGIAKANLSLKRGRVRRGNRTLWLASAVTRYLRSLAGTTTPAARTSRARQGATS